MAKAFFDRGKPTASIPGTNKAQEMQIKNSIDKLVDNMQAWAIVYDSLEKGLLGGKGKHSKDIQTLITEC